MEVGDYARYVGTGTVGIVNDVTEEEGVRWVLLDKTDLYYQESTLEPASEDDYRKVSEKEEKTLEERLEGIKEMREKSRQLEDAFDDVTPSGT
ncbi:MAG: DUF2098 domain-containing protein [Methanomassiliicoccales archaeon]